MLLPRSLAATALLVSTTLFHHVAAQVTTDCNPMNVTCPPDPALGTEVAFNFTSKPKASMWEDTVRGTTYEDGSAHFTIHKQGDCPTLRTKFYIFFGRTEIWMKTAPGIGVISSVMFLSDNLDEIDWEFMGGNNTHATTNYFGKGEPDFRNGGHHAIGGLQDVYHNYTSIWTKDFLDFYIDGNLVRRLLPQDADKGRLYPQTPMRLSIGIWAGGDPSLPEGTREWAGGTTDYSKGPFTMSVKSVQVADYGTGKEYVFSDKSGSWQSIKMVEGVSTVKEIIETKPEPTVSEKFESLSPTSKIAIYASAAGVGAVLLAFALFYCIKQRRRGAHEAKIAEQRADQERLELEGFRKAGIDPDSFTATATEYNAKDMRSGGLADANSYSVPNSPAGQPDEKWGAAAAVGAGAAGGAAAAGAMRSPMPLLQNGAQSPRGTGPASPNGFQAPYSDRSATHSPAPNNGFNNGQYHDRSPAHSPAPTLPNMGMGAVAPHPDTRSFSSPNPQMRNGTPGPQPGFGSPRTQSPAPMAQPMPQRSFTNAGGYGQPPSNMAQPMPQRSFTNASGYGQPPSTNQGYGQPFPFPQNGGGGFGNEGGQPQPQPQQGYWNGGGHVYR